MSAHATDRNLRDDHGGNPAPEAQANIPPDQTAPTFQTDCEDGHGSRGRKNVGEWNYLGGGDLEGGGGRSPKGEPKYRNEERPPGSSQGDQNEECDTQSLVWDDPEAEADVDDPAINPPPARPYQATCSREFRDQVLKEFGPLRGKEGEAYRRFFSYLVFPSHLDKETGLPVICGETVAWAADKVEQYRSGNYRTGEFLEDFQEYVLHGFRPSGYTPHLCRVVRDRGFRGQVLEWVENEIATPASEVEDRVYFVSGKPFSPKKQRAVRERERRRALVRLAEAGCGEAAEVMAYMNELAPNVFSKLIRENGPEAYRVARGLPGVEQRRAALATLHRIGDQPVPFYAPSTRGNTVRLFDQGSIAGLKKEVRHALMAGCTEFDLVSAQLAIIARLWDVPEVVAFLESGTGIWDELNDHLGVADEDRDAAKQTLKTALYALCFGAGDRKLKSELTRGLKTYCERPHDFLDHGVIRALREARDRQLEAVLEAGGAFDVYGVWRSTDCKETPEKGARSVLSQQAQAVELHLVFPVIELARKSRDFQVILWQHDGFSVRFSDQTKRGRWTRRIVEAVQDRADRLGVPTRLEYEVLGEALSESPLADSHGLSLVPREQVGEHELRRAA